MAPVFNTELLTPSYNTTGGSHPKIIIMQDGFTQSHGDLSAQDPMSIRFTGPGVISGHTYSVAVKFDLEQQGTGPQTIGTATGTFSGGSPQTVAITSLSEPTAAYTDSGFMRNFRIGAQPTAGYFERRFTWTVESTITTPIDGLTTTKTNFDDTDLSAADTSDPMVVPPYAWLAVVPDIVVVAGSSIDLAAGTITNSGTTTDRRLIWDIDWGTRVDENGASMPSQNSNYVDDDNNLISTIPLQYNTYGLSFKTTVQDASGNSVSGGGLSAFMWGEVNGNGDQSGLSYNGLLSAGDTVTWTLTMGTSGTSTTPQNNNCKVVVYQKTLTVV